MVLQLTNRLLFIQDHEDDVDSLLVLESPYDNELKEDCPCVGKSGLSMSKALLQKDCAVSFSKVLRDGCDYLNIAKRYALFDTFKFPIDENIAGKLDVNSESLWNCETTPWKKIKITDNAIGKELSRKRENTGTYDRVCHYKTLIQTMDGIEPNRLNSFLNEYKCDLIKTILKFRSLKQIVFCGFIAQSVFLKAFSKPYDRVPYRTNFRFKRDGIVLRFVEHPSRANKRDDCPPWRFTPRSKKILLLA